jgi:hypothetical protein
MFNSPESAIDQRQESAALRAGTLVGEHIITAGNSYVDISFENYFNPVSIEQKLDVIEGHFTNNGREAFTVEELVTITAYKKLKKRKHPTRDDLIFMKSLERDIDRVIKSIKENVLNSLRKSGMPQLRPLIKENLLGAFPVCSEDGELEDETHYRASKILQMDFNHNSWLQKSGKQPDEDDYDIFCLPFEFFTADFFKV